MRRVSPVGGHRFFCRPLDSSDWRRIQGANEASLQVLTVRWIEKRRVCRHREEVYAASIRDEATLAVHAVSYNPKVQQHVSMPTYHLKGTAGLDEKSRLIDTRPPLTFYCTYLTRRVSLICRDANIWIVLNTHEADARRDSTPRTQSGYSGYLAIYLGFLWRTYHAVLGHVWSAGSELSSLTT
ncbi:hypothetical protein LZ30DRAFT_694825 [Colletotrichum cereale]|nr:hypothetical protein LZ30DRAFT_694825 [Colletotrichum cereale]